MIFFVVKCLVDVRNVKYYMKFIKMMYLEMNIYKIYIYKSVLIICEIKLVSISMFKNVMFIYIRKGILIV